MFRDILADLRDNNVYMHVIAGNHDKVDQEDERSYISSFETHSNLKLYSKQETVEFADNFVIHFMPYFKEHGSYMDRLNTLIPIKDKFNLCLTHIAVNSVKNNDGTRVENGIPESSFNKFNLTMVGHYHDESWVDDNVWYFPGSYQANFGESNHKGFTLMYSDGSHEFIKSKFTEFVQIKLDVNNDKDIKSAEKLYKNSTDNIRFVFEGEEADLKKVSKEKLSEMGIEATFKKDSAVPLDNTGLIEKANSVSFNRKGINDAFDTFLEMKHVEDKTIGLKYLNKI